MTVCIFSYETLKACATNVVKNFVIFPLIYNHFSENLCFSGGPLEPRNISFKYFTKTCLFVSLSETQLWFVLFLYINYNNPLQLTLPLTKNRNSQKKGFLKTSDAQNMFHLPL